MNRSNKAGLYITLMVAMVTIVAIVLLALDVDKAMAIFKELTGAK